MNYQKSKKIKEKKCKICNEIFMPYKPTDMVCSSKCAYIYQKQHLKKQQIPIKQRSDKMQKVDREYLKLRKEFLSLPENQFCCVDGCNKRATTIEHTKGTIGKNYLDVSTWKPACFFHNSEFENNTELSRKYQESRFHDGKKIKK